MEAPEGFKFSAVECGIKYENRFDLGLIYCEFPGVAWGVFTKNSVKAAPVLLGKKIIKSEVHRAIVVNSGNANACTGQEGLEDAKRIINDLAEHLKVSEKEVLPASTGVIGERLPVNKILPKLKDLVEGLSPLRIEDFAKAIMTTDTKPKISYREVNGIKVLGIAKGAGMIAPNMATMLAFILTDGVFQKETIKKLLPKFTEESFNRITIDGDTSTNDTVYLVSSNRKEVKDYQELKQAILDVMKELAYKIVEDGEGVTKVIRIVIKGAKTKKHAKELAHAVANSPLVKTAFYGADPNWGRLFSAMGKTGIEFAFDKVEVYLNGVCWVNNLKTCASEEELKKLMENKDQELIIKLKEGRQSYEVLTGDLTEKYIEINAMYRS
ncbi:MAG: bifunctional glutamate N-acetyltransferase/amino-acid acetyltransferase ArgJ [Thermodesulfobacteria bacterium]|nr:bifunctional glutamate N-acetyltransferase/amino-acid acetyltransferase ArgJ [Thermodesulfobacteriota bacterium]